MKPTNTAIIISCIVMLLLAGCSGNETPSKVVVKQTSDNDNHITTIENDIQTNEEDTTDYSSKQTESPEPAVKALPSKLLQPTDLQYMGAFRLPDGDGTEAGGWEWGGSALTYYPDGDKNSAKDGYPGSLFMTGNDVHQYVGEINIPAPVKSRELSELNFATTLQPLTDIREDMFGNLELPRVGLQYLPAQKGQKAGKLYFTWGQHMQEGDDSPSHGWADTDLSNPNVEGPWKIKDRTKYITTDYIFSIPSEWAAANTPGMLLATGRFRDGGQGAQGPSLIAYRPWNQGNPPMEGASLDNIPLLMYISVYEPEESTHILQAYSHADEWVGGAWLASSDKTAVVFAGIKGKGDTWYGYSDGTESPTDGTEFSGDPSYTNGEHGERGWWSDSFEAQMIFYDPAEFAKVAHGEKNPYEPQPYATLNIDNLLLREFPEEKRHLGGVAYDRSNGVIYITEQRGDAENDRPVVHVWKIK
jgi:hypothetical protein